MGPLSIVFPSLMVTWGPKMFSAVWSNFRDGIVQSATDLGIRLKVCNHAPFQASWESAADR